MVKGKDLVFGKAFILKESSIQHIEFCHYKNFTFPNCINSNPSLQYVVIRGNSLFIK